jgi:hypothetical protein
MTPIDDDRMIRRPREVGPVRWCITAFGGVVFAILVIMVAFSLSNWALQKFDRLVDPESVIDERTP